MKRHITHKFVLVAFLIIMTVSSLPASAAVGDFFFTWGNYGIGDGQFDYPRGIAVDGSSNVYVVDTYNHRIQVFSSNGIFLGKWGNLGTGDGQFYYPRGIAVDGSGNVYVADTCNHRIQVFSSNGIFLGKWGNLGTEDGQFDYPFEVAIDKYSEVIYVADTYNNRIQSFEAYPTTNDVYNFSGFFPPLSLGKSFKLGRTIPVKFKLTDVDGNYISTAQVTIMLQKYLADEPIEEPIETTSKGRSNIGNTFRYDELNEQYIYNLNTKELSVGIWQIIVLLDDGTVKYTFISLE
jgi:DNA-binding beta-propeller fold protein YncE